MPRLGRSGSGAGGPPSARRPFREHGCPAAGHARTAKGPRSGRASAQLGLDPHTSTVAWPLL